MCDRNSLRHGTPHPRYRWRRRNSRKRESFHRGNHFISALLLGYHSQNANRKTASDSDRDMLGKAFPDNRPLKFVCDSNGILSLVANVYNKEGAEFLAKDKQGSAHQTRTAIQENGRIYEGQGTGSYMLPCDELEKDRLDFIHTMVTKALSSDRPIHVPHPENGRFLDLGCGTGLWAIEIAKAYPSAYVLGVDVSAIQPDSPPPNCVFRVPFDYERPWLMGEGKWDVIHMRMGCGSVTNWPRLYKRIYDHLHRGAWFEQLEIIFEPRCFGRRLKFGPLRFWYYHLKAATERSERGIEHCPGHTRQWLGNAGFRRISCEEFVLPLNASMLPIHDKESVRWYRTVFAESILPLCMAPFSRVYGWSYDYIQSLATAAVAEALDPSSNLFYTLRLYKAWRPLDEATVFGGTTP
ncbi:S-adenosyl-L-methionine-dependent methyltransferase [Aspergillus floccosus]